MKLQEKTKLRGGDIIIGRALGQGGFGITYLAKMKTTVAGKLGSTTTWADVVVKEYFLEAICERGADGRSVRVRDQEKSGEFRYYREKFRKEAGNLSKMCHEGIVDVVDIIDNENGTTYYVMSYLSGGSLFDRAAPKGIAERDALRYTEQVARALQYMHQRKACHYDVKPSNIMLDADDRARLIDFGFAEEYQDKNQKSTLSAVSQGYSPLEQGSVKTFSPTVDIYSTGATLFYLLTGRSPGKASFRQEDVIGAQRPQGMSEKAWLIISLCMKSAPNDRIQSMDDLLSMLAMGADDIRAKYVDHGHTVKIDDPGTPGLVERIAKAAGAYWKPVAVAAVVAAAGAVGAVAVRDCKGSPVVLEAEVAMEEGDTLEIAPVEEEILRDVSNMYCKIDGTPCSYTGTVDSDDKPHGRGTAVWDGVGRYEGPFVHGVMEGDSATFTYSDGNVFAGSFKANKMERGRLTWADDGSYFEGAFTNGIYDTSKGKLYNADGTAYE